MIKGILIVVSPRRGIVGIQRDFIGIHAGLGHGVEERVVLCLLRGVHTESEIEWRRPLGQVMNGVDARLLEVDASVTGYGEVVVIVGGVVAAALGTFDQRIGIGLLWGRPEEGRSPRDTGLLVSYLDRCCRDVLCGFLI